MCIASIIFTLHLVLCAPGQTQSQQQQAQQRIATKRRSLTPSEIAKKALPSLVEVITEKADGSPGVLGSGFFVRLGRWDLIATNYHVVEGASSIGVRIVDSEFVDRTHWKVRWIDDKNDLALLMIDWKKDTAPPSPPTADDFVFIGNPLPIGSSKRVKVGDEVFAVGNPKGFEGTFSQGIVSALRGADFIQITAPISEGSSGGPVLNKWGEVIGVVAMIAKDGQNLNFVIPSTRLTALLNKARTTTLPKIPSGRTPSLAANTNTPSSKGSQDLSREYYRRAHEYFDAGLYDKAIETCKQVLKIEPKTGYSCLGEYSSRLGLHQESLDAYKEVIRIDPDDGWTHFEMGNEYFELGRYKEAMEAHEESLRLGQKQTDSIMIHRACIGLGLAHNKLGNFFLANKFFEQASRAWPESSGVGAAYAKLGDAHSAIKAYKEAIQVKPDAFTYIRLGDAYTEAGLYQEAIEALEQALRIDPNGSLAYYQLGLTYLKLGNKGLALEQYKSLKKLAETDPQLKALADELFNLIYK